MVEDFVANGVIKRRSKTIAVLGMAVAAVVVALTPMDLVTKFAALAAIALGAIYVVTRPGQAVNELPQ